jgi:predicted enzyme related to lactoylglutathione lyase
MLAKAAEATIPAADLDRARKFYEEQLGLTAVHTGDDGIVYKVGNTYFLLYPTQFAGTAQNTMMGFVVDDLDSTMADLKERGIEFEEYDYPELKTVNGVAEFDAGKGAWFKDTEGNILAVTQINYELP